jgi:hypothetical protein
MAEALRFHHAPGQTPGVFAFADGLRRAGRTVDTPDFYAGRTVDDLDEGVAHAQEIGFGDTFERGMHAADDLPSGLVYGGFPLGVLPAQSSARPRPGPMGALLFHPCVPVPEFGSLWPADVPVQAEAMEADPLFVEYGDRVAARALVGTVDRAELFLFPGDRHLLAEPSLLGTTKVQPFRSPDACWTFSELADTLRVRSSAPHVLAVSRRSGMNHINETAA